MTVLSAMISHEKPPRRISAGGMDDAYIGGIDMADSTCAVDDCERTDLIARGWCRMHYGRWQRNKELGPAEPHRVRNSGNCKHADGCLNPAKHKGWCEMHRARILRNGEPGPAERLRAETGSTDWRKSATGYMRRPGGASGTYELQHRVVMEQVLGRPLEDFETVHHINGVRHDNRPGNLELWVVPQPYGRRARDLARWVVETYPDEVAQLFQDSLFGNEQAVPTT